VIRVVCPNCQAKLNAKDELFGQTRNCPRCGSAVVIAPEDVGGTPSAAAPTDSTPESEGAGEVPAVSMGHVEEAPTRLDRANRYLICDSARVIATWENNGQGWRLKTDHGYASAARNPEKIPSEGDFKLVVLKMAMLGVDLRLRGIRVYQLARRWALLPLERGDDPICKSIVGHGALLRAQKDAIRQHLQEKLMRTVWGDAAEVLDYLTNDDYHSPGVGE